MSDESPSTMAINNGHDKRKIKISKDKVKSSFYYSDLATRFLETEDYVDISGLGRAISKVCLTVEYLKSNNVITVKKIQTGMNSSVELIVTVEKGPNHSEYLKSMEERKKSPPMHDDD
ncbi:hypothetical protein PPL_10125 [Heterostelium album PN500]|uniref:DNA/RNA-binding protein Alba-like domain-containing protein n=1 Tax=Heterostelium pallidum (strain ATCC 26659 / Pp 5 / PN500) TaxID=670386 RepID=D3BQE0_HETP5|nr:hypothetical protein PPL_10125 [Heterostelium album PN500]EFA76360.1 hypothetical protein PPL_10125 [Heterostelium album PN500]|eukprot:XP_020428492.1 hypothetical protein PPL_10125 [Heterostelium album PN500]